MERGPLDAATVAPRAPRGDVPPVPLGTEIAGRYRLLELLGRGGMGVVYRARDLRLEIDVALKWIASAELDAVRDEVRLARMVTHPAVCRLHDLVESEHGAWLSMEHVDGESLADRLATRGPPPTAEARLLLTDLADALAAAHAAGVVHRDLKPANILVRPDGHAVIVDFGIATRPGEGAGAITGTRGWMPPEQAHGAAADPADDLHAFATLARLLLPAHPLPEADAATLAAHLREVSGTSGSPGTSGSRKVSGTSRAPGTSEGISQPRKVSGTLRAIVIAGVLVAGALVAGVLWLRRSTSGRPAKGLETVVLRVVGDRLAGQDEWLPDVVGQLVAEELVDAWGLAARVARPDVRTSEAIVEVHLSRDASGRLVCKVPDTLQVLEITGEGPREVAEGLAAAVVEREVPEELRHPSRAELEGVGARSALAWRVWRRAQRAARMQRWDRVRELVAQAAEMDRGFGLPQLELALSFEIDEPAAAEALRRAGEGIAAAARIDPWWPAVLEVVRAAAARDDARAAAAFEAVRGMALPERERLQFEHRWALGFLQSSEHARGVAMLEAVAERWPDDAGALKALARFHVGPSDAVDNAAAVRLGERAVALAPHDVGARADWARALAVAGRRDEARAQARIAERGDAADRRADALRLYQLHMALGELDRAAEDARRLTGVAGAEPLAAACVAFVDLHRGAFTRGMRGLEESAARYQRSGQARAAQTQWTTAGWQALVLDDAAAARRHFAAASAASPSAQADVLALVAEHRETGAARALDDARAIVDRMPADAQARAMLATVIAHAEGRWDEVIRLFRLQGVDGSRVEVTYLAGDAMVRGGRADDAERLFTALVAQPMSWIGPIVVGEAWDRIGELRERAGDTAGAIAAYRALTERWRRADLELPRLRHAQARLRALTAEPSSGGR